MKTFSRLLGLLVVLLPGMAFAQIANTAHDLGSGSTADVRATTETQLCKFCHTPHVAQSTQLLWNHTQTAAVAFTWGNDLDGNALTATTEGTTLPTALRNASKRCLACHDGTVAIGDVSNANGGVAGIMPITTVAGRSTAGGLMIGGNRTGVGGNLGGNHPVSVPYAGETYGLNVSGVPAAKVGAAVIGGYYNVVTAGCTSPSGVCTSATGGALNGAAINLIPFTPGGTTNVGVECTTCHDPHGVGGGVPYFARVPVAGSALCRSCHNK